MAPLVLLRFFKNLVGTSAHVSTSLDLENLLLPNALSTTQASDLLKPFTLEEIKEALWAMKDDASPGPDGFGPSFYKSNWNLVKPDLLNLMNEFHAGTADFLSINTATLCSFPKNQMLLHLRTIGRFPSKISQLSLGPSASP